MQIHDINIRTIHFFARGTIILCDYPKHRTGTGDRVNRARRGNKIVLSSMCSGFILLQKQRIERAKFDKRLNGSYVKRLDYRWTDLMVVTELGLD